MTQLYVENASASNSRAAILRGIDHAAIDLRAEHRITPNLKIRTAREGDIKSFAGMENEDSSINSNHGMFDPDSTGGFTLIAEMFGKPVGQVSCSFDDEATIEVDGLWVHHKARGAGVGRALAYAAVAAYDQIVLAEMAEEEYHLEELLDYAADVSADCNDQSMALIADAGRYAKKLRHFDQIRQTLFHSETEEAPEI